VSPGAGPPLQLAAFAAAGLPAIKRAAFAIAAGRHP
jgi:hypothetical protein